MHTTRLGNDWIAIHNGVIDPEDLVLFRKIDPDTDNILQSVELPFSAIKMLMASQFPDSDNGARFIVTRLDSDHQVEYLCQDRQFKSGVMGNTLDIHFSEASAITAAECFGGQVESFTEE